MNPEVIIKESEHTKIRSIQNKDKMVSSCNSKLSGRIAEESYLSYTESRGVGSITTMSSNPPIGQDPTLWRVNDATCHYVSEHGRNQSLESVDFMLWNF
jgi:hypothetical protein